MSGRAYVVGFGNTARGDDGVGPLVVRRLRASGLSSARVRFLVREELSDDLLDCLKEASLIIFVDSSVGKSSEDVHWKKIQASRFPSSFTHAMTPQTFLWLLHLVKGKRPEAWLVAIPGEEFESDGVISPKAMSMALKAEVEIKQFLKRWTRKDKTFDQCHFDGEIASLLTNG